MQTLNWMKNRQVHLKVTLYCRPETIILLSHKTIQQSRIPHLLFQPIISAHCFLLSSPHITEYHVMTLQLSTEHNELVVSRKVDRTLSSLSI